MSAAFDLVDISLLTQKMELYGFDNHSLKWMNSYLSGRRQCVCIDGVLSKFQNVDTGVPQGSILGPLFYIIFTNELPEVIHNHNENENSHNEHSYSLDCIKCGGLCCFADDSTCSISDKDPKVICEKLETKYELISDYMSSNKLKLNSDKTHLMVMMTDQLRRRHQIDIKLNTKQEYIEPTENEKMLGGIISQNLKWTDHIQNDKKSLIKNLTTRLNGLKKISNLIDFRTRKMIVNGIFMSKLIYLIPLWGGCEKFLIKSLQVIQNKAARTVTKLDRYTRTETLLNQCNWLSVNQLVAFHSLTLVYKTLKHKSPKYLYKQLTGDSQCKYNTRFARNNSIGPRHPATNQISNRSFVFRASSQWNNLPIDIQEAETLSKFKQSLKKWIKSNIPI